MPTWIIFTDDGIPAWFGPSPVAGAELVDLTEVCDAPAAFLPVMRRVDGAWVPREPATVTPPTAEAIEAAREAEAIALAEAEAARLADIELEIVRLSGPDQLLRSMGKITIAELTLRVAAIRARVEGAA